VRESVSLARLISSLERSREMLACALRSVNSRLTSRQMLSSSQLGLVLVGAVLPHALRLVLRLCLRSSVYEDDRDVVALNMAAPPTRWFNLGWWSTG